MKKLYIIIISFLLLIPINTFAYGIEDFYINATILDNGDLEVEEYFNLNGTYNGMERIYYFKNSNTKEFDPNSEMYGGSSIHNGSDILIEEVKSVNIDHNFDFSNNNGYSFSKTNTASKGDYGVYTLNSLYNGSSILIYMTNSMNKAFYVKYKIKNIAVLHNDIGELGWTIFNTSFNESIDNLIININIPNNNNITKIWAHGPLNGNSSILSNKLVQANIRDLSSNTAIDIRVVFDKEVLLNSNKKTNVDALDKIIKYETTLADQANYQREANIEYKFYELNNTPSREKYDNVLNYINQYNNVDKMAEYLNRLYSYKDKVDSYEYNEFMNLINKNDYNSYRWALLYLDKVFDSKLKDNMNNKLSNLKYNLQLIELKRELIYVIISILTIILSYIIINISKYSHRFIKKVDPLYIRNIPNDLSLVSSGILIDKEITSDEVTASILDLIRRKIIIKDNHFENGDVYIKNEELINNIDSKDECLLKMIFGTEKSINFKKIRIIDKIRFNSWKGLFINELKGKEFINLTEQKPIQVSLQLCVVIIILLLIGSYGLGLIIILLYAIKKYRFYLPISLLLVANFISIRNVLFNNHFFYYSIILNIISIIIICLCTKKIPFKLNIKLTKKGEEKKKELYALRNFLNDFSRLNEKEIPEVYLWEQYLVYATLFGIGNKVLKSMKLKIEENNLNINLNSVLLDSINVNSFDRISNNISSMSAPKIDFKTFSSGSGGDWGSSSSSSGSGGGFSGGSDSGGSFGGGSGGGRF